MHITIREYTRYDEAQVLALYRSVGWTRYTDAPGRLEAGFANSLRIYAAFDGAQLVGLCRAVGDGLTIVYVQDLLVHPAYQRKGIGRELLGRMLEEYKEVYQKALMTDDTPETTAFYQSMGMRMAADLGCLAFLC